jgi:hypothetical protein
LTATNGSTDAAPTAIRCLPPIRSIVPTAASRSYKKQWAIKKILHKEETKINALDKKMIYNHINGESL